MPRNDPNNGSVTPSTNVQSSTSCLWRNNLLSNVSEGKICTAFGVKFITGNEIVHIAKSAGYDSLFIDLEHTALTTRDVAQLSITALSTQITPFVRVPHECGAGLLQRVLDNGAMGIIIPHVRTIADVKAVIEVAKYAPLGHRSLTSGFPHCAYKPVPPAELCPEMNSYGSTVFIMIETVEALAIVDDIAAEPGCEVLLVGSNDLAQEIGTLGDWDAPKFLNALERVGDAARRHGKIMGIAGLYHRPDILSRVINEFGARWILGALDVGTLVQGTQANAQLLSGLQRSRSD